MLPLVRQLQRRWDAGWCTYTDGFDNNPDVEVFSGGENEKTATAAALWRQGNLLHFGFEQSPAEMNEIGQKLLLNCIAYISRFTEDRPIAVTPSVFGGTVAYPRTYLDRRLKDKGDVDAAWRFLSAKTQDKLVTLEKEEVRQWYAENRPYLHPDESQKLEVDVEAKLLGAPIDDLEFFSKTVAALSDSTLSESAKRLLRRYGPEETHGLKSAKEWQEWVRAHRLYLFFSDQGDYRWYVDPLAKKRGVPSVELRGSARASD